MQSSDTESKPPNVFEGSQTAVNKLHANLSSLIHCFLQAGKRGGGKGDDDDDYDEEEEEAWEPGRKRKAALKSKARYRELSGMSF